MKKKPRILRIRGRWVVADGLVRMPAGGFLYYPIGEGLTIKEAWANSYPGKNWWGRLVLWMDKNEC